MEDGGGRRVEGTRRLKLGREGEGKGREGGEELRVEGEPLFDHCNAESLCL